MVYSRRQGKCRPSFARAFHQKKTLEENGDTISEGYYWTSTRKEEARGISTQCGIYDYPEDEERKWKSTVCACHADLESHPKPAETYTLVMTRTATA